MLFLIHFADQRRNGLLRELANGFAEQLLVFREVGQRGACLGCESDLSHRMCLGELPLQSMGFDGGVATRPGEAGLG